jgi:thioredoxin reductase
MSEQHEPTAVYDAVVIGGGAAGLSAALVLARSLRRVIVVDAGSPRNAPSRHLHGFLSREGTSPARLLEIGREEVRRYGGEVISGRVTEVRRSGAELPVTTAGPPIGGPDGPPLPEPAAPVRLRFEAVLAGDTVLVGDTVLHARRLLVATGCSDRLPDVPGLVERWGIDVLHCPYCDGWEVRDRPLAVLGTGDLSVRQALMLRQWSAEVTLVGRLSDDPSARGRDRERLAARGIRVMEGQVDRLLVRDDALAGVGLADGMVVGCHALFVSPDPLPNLGVLSDLGCTTDEAGWLRVDEDGATDVHGIWAAGNVVDPALQIASAVDAGSRAALALNADLIAEDVSLAVHHGHRA